MSAAKWFDTEAELQKLRSPMPKPPKAPKVEEEDKGNFSHFSHFRLGAGTKTQISVPQNPLPADVPSHDDARIFDSESGRWLRHKLASGPQRVADLMRVWLEPVVGRPSGEISARIDLLNDARWELDAEPFEGPDGKMWWRLLLGADAASWLCPHCGRPATIEDVFPSSDGERTLTMWSCEPCQVVAVTPDAIKEPPTGWAPKTKQ